jgi:hypothetical protein
MILDFKGKPLITHGFPKLQGFFDFPLSFEDDYHQNFSFEAFRFLGDFLSYALLAALQLCHIKASLFSQILRPLGNDLPRTCSVD